MSERFQELAGRCSGTVTVTGDDRWKVACQAWNLAVEQRPVAIVFPESAADCVAIVDFARESGLRVAFNGGGHNAGPINWDDEVLLVKTERMRGLTIDAEARRARVVSARIAGGRASSAARIGGSESTSRSGAHSASTTFCNR